MKEFVIELIRWFYFRGVCFRKPIEKKILCMSFNGKQYSDNPRALSEKMHELYPEYKIVWYLTIQQKYNIVPPYVEVVNGRWMNFLKELATAQCFITNTQMGYGVFKRKGQVFIQTWHGDVVPKQVLFDDIHFKRNTKGKLVVKDSKYADFCVAGSDIGEHVYKTAFRYSGKILKYGMPRNDRILCEENIEDVRRLLKIKKTKKILLYAPTFRDNITTSVSHFLDVNQILHMLEEKGEEWCCLVRGHINSPNVFCDFENESIINVSEYPDMADLLAISDMLITDYSSSPGDFVLTGRPVILYQFDYKDYEKNCRNFVYDFEDAGFVVARDRETLKNIVKNFTLADYYNSDKFVIEYFNIITSGRASERICKLIHEMIIPNSVERKQGVA